MAKAKSRQVQRARARAAHHVDPERWNRLLIIGAVVAAIVVALGFIGFGWYQTQVKPKGKVVLQVGETKFTLGHLERRMSLFMKEEGATLFQSPSPELFAALPGIVLGNLEEEGRLLAGASELKIEVTEEEFSQEIATRGGVAPDAADDVFAEAYRDLVDESDLREDEYRQMVKAELLQRKVQQYFGYVAPAKEPQVRARWIQVATEDDAELVVQRLNAGEDFAAVAREVSQDTASRDQGGELDWQARGGFLAPEIEDFLFSAQVGQRSDPIQTPAAVYIVELLEKDENRELSEEQKQAVVTRLVNEWLESLDSKLTIKDDLFTEEDRNRALSDVLG